MSSRRGPDSHIGCSCRGQFPVHGHKAMDAACVRYNEFVHSGHDMLDVERLHRTNLGRVFYRVRVHEQHPRAGKAARVADINATIQSMDGSRMAFILCARWCRLLLGSICARHGTRAAFCGPKLEFGKRREGHVAVAKQPARVRRACPACPVCTRCEQSRGSRATLRLRTPA